MSSRDPYKTGGQTEPASPFPAGELLHLHEKTGKNGLKAQNPFTAMPRLAFGFSMRPNSFRRSSCSLCAAGGAQLLFDGNWALVPIAIFRVRNILSWNRL